MLIIVDVDREYSFVQVHGNCVISLDSLIEENLHVTLCAEGVLDLTSKTVLGPDFIDLEACDVGRVEEHVFHDGSSLEDLGKSDKYLGWIACEDSSLENNSKWIWIICLATQTQTLDLALWVKRENRCFLWREVDLAIVRGQI